MIMDTLLQVFFLLSCTPPCGHTHCICEVMSSPSDKEPEVVFQRVLFFHPSHLGGSRFNGQRAVKLSFDNRIRLTEIALHVSSFFSQF